MHNSASHSFKKCWLSFIASSALVLAGCGGGGGSSSSSSASVTVVTGTAAVGSPIVGATATAKCASSTTLPTSATSSVGGLSVTLTGQTFPCVVQITGGTINGVANTTAYHSVAMSAGNVNATPLTDLLIANLAGTATPSTWFANLTTAQLAAITQTKVNTALTNLQDALGSTLPTSINPITTAFTPAAGVQMDDVLSALAIALTNHGTSHANLLASADASTGAAFTPPAGFGAAFATGFTKTLTGGGAPSPTSFSPTTVALGGTVTITGTNLMPVTQVIFTGPAAGTHIDKPTEVSACCLRASVGVSAQTATSVSIVLPTNVITGSYALAIRHPGGEISVGGTLDVTTDGNPKVTVLAPTSFTATASGRKVILNWQAVIGAKGYNIYKSTSPSVSVSWSSKVASCASCTSTSPTVSDGAITTFTDGKSPTQAYYDPGWLSPSTKYYYVIRAFNIDGDEGASSAEVSATTGP
jgi:hypothetical protein